MTVAGDKHRSGEAQKKGSPVDTLAGPGDEQAGDHGEDAGHGDALASLTFGDLKAGRDRREQADGHEFRSDQRRHAQRHRKHRWPTTAGRTVRVTPLFPCLWLIGMMSNFHAVEIGHPYRMNYPL